MALTQTQVSQLYVSIFNRASEGKGNTNWQTKGTMDEVANLMLATPDAKDYFGSSLSNQEFIETIYKNTLNKTLADDEAGIANWTAKLESGMTRGKVVAEIIEAIYSYAPDAINYDPNDQTTINAYNQFINRVDVSNYMANTVETPPADYKTSTQFAPLGELVVTDSAATVTTAKTSVDALKPVPGQTFTLTTGVDGLKGTDKADLFNAALTTVNDGDTLDGGAGVDILNAQINAIVSDKFKSSNIEKVNLTTYGDQAVDMKNITGVETVTTKNSTGTLTLNNVANSTVGFGFEGNLKNTITANHVAGALDGKNDILNVNLNAAKGVILNVAAGFESAKITTTGTSDVTTLTASGVSTYIVEGTGNVNFNNNLTNVNTLTATNNSGAITTKVNATTGFADNVIAAGANGASVFLGAGNDNVGFTATAGKSSAIKLGAGDDKLLLTTTATGTYVFGEAGNDTIKATNGLTATDLIDGGEGTDTLVLAATGNNDMVLRGVEKLTLTNTAIGTNDIKSADSAIAVTVEAGNAAVAAKATAATITGLTSGSTVTVNDSKGQTDGVGALTVEYKTLEAAATIDVNSAQTGAVTIKKVSAATIDYAKAADSSAAGITTDETTSLNIIAAKDVSTGAIASSNKLKTLTITGQDTVTTGAVSSTALETVTVSGVKNIDINSATAAFAEAGKLKTVNVTSTTGDSKVGSIGGASKNNTTDALNITVSAAKAATLGTVGDATGSGKLGDISVTATNGLLTAGAITGTDAGTITLTSTAGAIDGTAAQVTVADATGVTVNMTAKTFINATGATGGGAITVQNTGGNITASLAGTATAKVDYTVSAAKGVVNLTATNTGGLTSTITNNSVIADALTSTITLGNAVATTAKNDITVKGAVATLNVTGGTGEDNIILDGAQVKSGTIDLGTGTDSVNFDGIVSAVGAATLAAGVVINLGSTAHSVGTQSVAAGHAVEYNAAAGLTAKKLVTDGFELKLSGVEKVTGTDFADIIIANAAGSTITGGDGNDTMISGAGADTYVITDATTDSTSAAMDSITSFNLATDKIDLATAVAGATTSGGITFAVAANVGASAGTTNGIATGMFTFDKAAATSLSDAITKVGADVATAGSAVIFEYAGDTYFFADTDGATTTANDLIIKLVGVDSTSMSAAAEVFTIA